MNFIFRMPDEDEGGIRRFYILFIAAIEIAMVRVVSCHDCPTYSQETKQSLAFIFSDKSYYLHDTPC